MLNIPAPVGEYAYLSPNVVADGRQLPGEIVAHQPVGGQAPLKKALELAGLAGLEATGIAEYLNGGLRAGGGGWEGRVAAPGWGAMAGGAGRA